MKHKATKTLACLLAAALLVSLWLPALAKNGPYVPEEEDGWNYARLELLVLDENEEPVTVIDEEYGYPETKALALYANGKATAQEGAVYDPDTNTLTLTDFNTGNYVLRVNLMGDDFTLCVKGNCRLSGIEVNGGGVMQPVWGCGLRITGSGTLNVNPNKTADSGVYFWPQEEKDFSFTVDPGVTLNVYGKQTAVEVYGYIGTFRMTVDGKTETVEGKKAEREGPKMLDGYSNPMEWKLALCKNSADPDGVYTINKRTPGNMIDDVFVPDENIPPFVVVERYIYLESLDLYVRDYDWERERSGGEGPDEVRFDTMEAAAAAGFTPILDGEGKQECRTVNYLGNNGSESIYKDAEGHEYAVGFGPDDEGHYNTIAMTIEPIAELPGKYLFTYTKDVDPKTLTEITEIRVFDDMFDYAYPDKEFRHQGETGDKYVYIDRIDISLNENAIPWGRAIAPEEMFRLLLDDLFTVETKGVGLRFRRVNESGTGKYQTLPVTASRLFSDNPFELFSEDREYALELTFYTGYDAASGKPIRFADNTSLYVNGKKASEGAPLTEDVDGMIVAGDIVLAAGTYKKPADAPGLMPGDVDGNGEINSADARLCLRRAVDLETYEKGSDKFIACDVDKNNEVTSADARKILRAAVELEDPGTW